ncbi:MAG: amidohydrolase [Candidatus Abyssobacteria bacterium SURF_17]|uniref:Amidohydrolase n=1 Tax=Candidatus Abyssobacteria bacterium SURF_17 TaxID=2093361 RepID=A0A419EYE3_9BACT|nr:MAG: amidohydrolase [Candidatus Abyssubacteria bacterium SURF_17]
MKTLIREQAGKLFDWLVETRRDLHAHPELGLQEVRTSARVAEELGKLGLEVKTGIGTTGVVGLLRGTSPGGTIAIRADMDALPITEETGLPFASQNEGLMHACGHDGHVAMALGAARVLSNLRERIRGNVKFIMQPAEENYGGARDMVAEGALENPKVDAIIALHVDVHEPVGKLVIKSGPVGAAADVFMVSINGKGGHGSEPQACIDPIHIAAHAIIAIQTMIPRKLDAREPVVVSVCSIQGGTAFNVIPDSVHFGGTVRTLSRERRAEMPKRLEEIVRGTTSTFGATYDFTYIHGAPVTSNEPGMTELMRSVASELWGIESVIEMDKPHMGSEDYSYYLIRAPGAMGMLGARKTGAPHYPAHHPKFDFDEGCLPLGVELLAATAIKYLNGVL